MSDDEHGGIERVGFTQFTATQRGISGPREMSAIEGCVEAAELLLRKIGTRPGEDEEVIVQVIKRRREERSFRDVITERIDR